MKTIAAYWDTEEYDPTAIMYPHYMRPVRKFTSFEVPDDATEDEIINTARRKDLKLDL